MTTQKNENVPRPIHDGDVGIVLDEIGNYFDPMTESPKTFTGQGSAIRRLCEAVLELQFDNANDFTGEASRARLLEDLERAQELARALLDSVPRKRGNPAINEAMQASIKSKRDSAATRKIVYDSAIRDLRAKGARTYAAIAEGLNKRGIKPYKADKWSPGLVRAFDPDRPEK